jgi:hypothetical protein
LSLFANSDVLARPLLPVQWLSASAGVGLGDGDGVAVGLGLDVGVGEGEALGLGLGSGLADGLVTATAAEALGVATTFELPHAARTMASRITDAPTKGRRAPLRDR